MKGIHCVFFDDTCPLCRKSVEQLIRRDKKKLLVFAPLNGETANEKLFGKRAYLKQASTLVLMENYQKESPRFWLKARAIFRIFWLLKGKWRLIGWLSFFPIGFDLIYQLVARFRHHISWKNPEDKLYRYSDRFLP